jgi:hypothetical protein
MGRFTKRLRRLSHPARDVLLRPLAPLVSAQRSVPLRGQDFTVKRVRKHVLVDLVYRHCPARDVVLAEIGVRGGRTTEHLLRYCPQISRIFAVDIVRPGEQSPLHRLAQVTFLHGPSVEMAQQVPDGSLDLVFIDADHSEAAVRADIRAWLPKVRQDGIIAGHDYGSRNHPGVKIAVDEACAGRREPLHLEANKVWWTLR